MNASHVSHLLFLLFQSVHRAHGGVARFFRGKSIGDAFLDFLLEVKLEFFVQLQLQVAAPKEGAKAKGDGVPPMLRTHRTSLGALLRSSLLESDNMGDGGREALPVRCLRFELFPTQARQRIKFRAPVILGLLPLGGDPAFLLQLVQCWIKGSFADLQHVSGDGFQAETDGPAVHGLKRENLQEKKVERALNQVRWFAHGLSSVTEGMIHRLPSVSKGNFPPQSRQQTKPQLPFGAREVGYRETGPCPKRMNDPQRF